MANEKRLIDLDKAFEAIKQEVWWTESEKAYFRSFLAKQPKADAVEVVRCKDCKHWSDGVAGCTDHVKCCKIGYYFVGENGYCVYGERKET